MVTCNIISVFLDSYNSSKLLNNAGKHNYQLSTINFQLQRKGTPPGDVMKTPLLKDLSTLRLCNPPAFRLLLWPAISKRSQLGFRCNLMSIPIEPAQLPISVAKIQKKIESAMLRPQFFMYDMRFF